MEDKIIGGKAKVLNELTIQIFKNIKDANRRGVGKILVIQGQNSSTNENKRLEGW